MDFLKVYGFDMQSILNSVAIQDVKILGNRAIVRYSMDILGESVSLHLELQEFEGGWYNPDVLAEVK